MTYTMCSPSCSNFEHSKIVKNCCDDCFFRAMLDNDDYLEYIENSDIVEDEDDSI